MPKPVTLQLVSCQQPKTPPAGPHGRYDRHDYNTYSGLTRATAPLNVRTAIAKVQDPSERDPTAPRQRIAVTVNRNVDVLETERSHERISEAAYRTGRIIQAVFEKQRGMRTTFRVESGGSVDAARANEMAIAFSVDAARKVVEITADIGKVIGGYGTMLLRELICEGKSFAQLAERQGKAGEKGTRFIAESFRVFLEKVAEEWGAEGSASSGVLSADPGAPQRVVREARKASPARRSRPPIVAGRSEVTASAGRAQLRDVARLNEMSGREVVRYLLRVPS